MNITIKILFLFTSIILLNSWSQDENIELNDEDQFVLEENSQEIESQRMSPLPYSTIINIIPSLCGNGNVSVPFSVISRSMCDNLYLRWTHAELYPYYLSGNWDIKIYLKWTDNLLQPHSEVLNLNEHFDYYLDDYPFVPSTIGRWFFSPDVPAKFKFRISMTNTSTGCNTTSAVELYNVPCD